MISSAVFMSRLAGRFSATWGTVVQVALLILVWAAGALLVDAFAMPVSAGVAGMLLVLALLLTGAVPVERVRRGADWMLGELVLFFIPAVVAVVQYGDLFRHQGVALIGAVVLGTVLVMVATALAVRLGCGLEHRLACRRRGRRWQRLRQRAERGS